MEAHKHWNGGKVRELREKRGMTQDELARKIGYSNKSAIAHIESGRSIPPLDKMLAIADALDCNADYLLEGLSLRADELTRITQVAQEKKRIQEEAEEEVINLMRKLPEREQWKLVGRIQAYVDFYYSRSKR